MIAFCLLNSAVILYNLVKGLDSYLPLALFWGYLAAEGLGKYQVRRERKYLWVVVCGAVASLCFLLCYVLRTRGTWLSWWGCPGRPSAPLRRGSSTPPPSWP